MSAVGNYLKETREAKQLTVYQVAEMTKIRSDHIRALDEGNYDVFSAPVYIRGFVRTYAVALKLDPKKVLDMLNEELSGSGPQAPSLSEPSGSALDKVLFQLSKFNRKMALPVLGGILIAGSLTASYLVWRHTQQADPLEGLQPGVYSPPTSSHISAETLDLPQPSR